MKHRFVWSRTPELIGARLDRGCSNRPSKFWLSFVGASLITASLLFVASFPGAQATDGESPVATWSHGVLHVTIPYHGLHAGAGLLTLELLDPDDELLERSAQRV